VRDLPAGPVFDRAQARALGWTDSAISRAVRSGRLIAVRRGQFAPPSRDRSGNDAGPLVARYFEQRRDSIRQAQAAARSWTGGVISHQSAALIYDLPLIGRPPGRPALTVAPRAADGAVNVHVHRATLPGDDVVRIDGFAVTSAARTVVDLGRTLSTSAAVAALDCALHRHLTTPAEIEAVLLRCWNWPGIRRAARAMALADARSESPLESISRLVLRRLHLPLPVPQPEIFTAPGVFIGRVDFYWDEFGVVGEADGAGKYDLAPTSLLEEKRRQEALEDAGVVVTRWGWDQVRRPRELGRQVTAAFERARARDRSGFHRKWSVGPPKPTISDGNVISERAIN
jgi:Transcriptional regulator, AbiEi antitoxin